MNTRHIRSARVMPSFERWLQTPEAQEMLSLVVEHVISAAEFAEAAWAAAKGGSNAGRLAAWRMEAQAREWLDPQRGTW